MHDREEIRKKETVLNIIIKYKSALILSSKRSPIIAAGIHATIIFIQRLIIRISVCHLPRSFLKGKILCQNMSTTASIAPS